MTRPLTEFEADTRCTPDGDGRFRVDVSDRWSVGTGANGGYAAGLLARAIDLATPDRPLRSMTAHFLRPPTPGPATVEVDVVRAGRSLSVLDAALVRDGEALVVARAAVASPREAVSFCDRPAPDFPPPAELEREDWGEPDFIRRRYDTRYVEGTMPPVLSGRGVVSGWIRTVDDCPVDRPLAVALTDAWVPPVLMRTDPPLGASTIDLTIHLFDTLDEPYEGWCATTNTSTVLADGYVDTDTEVWTDDGRLLATARQLAATFPRPPMP